MGLARQVLNQLAGETQADGNDGRVSRQPAVIKAPPATKPGSGSSKGQSRNEHEVGRRSQPGPQWLEDAILARRKTLRHEKVNLLTSDTGKSQ